MGTLFTLTNDIKTVIQTALDDLITELGKTCRLVYPPRWESCLNCKFDPTKGSSANIWRTGGPIQFSDGQICPVCSGKGQFAVEVSDTIQMLIAWEPRSFYVPIRNVDMRVPHGIIQAKSYLTDVPRLLKADHLVVQLPIEGLIRSTYKLAGGPGDPSNIIQNRYAITTWEQKG